MRFFICEREDKIIKPALEWLERTAGIEPEVEGCPLKSELSRKFASIRVINPFNRELNEPLPKEIEYEERKVRECLCGRGAVYSAVHFAILLSELNEAVFITPDLIATYEDRWHLRYALFSYPTIISLGGIVEAPARPREYYLMKAKGIPDIQIYKSLGERYFVYGDPRMPDVLKGIFLQAFFFFKTGYPFCEEKTCKLYNAHWQEEFIVSQLEGKLCEKHRI